jgi:ABC-type glycerol-3-phosphate transport system substrate-binding protein
LEIVKICHIFLNTIEQTTNETSESIIKIIMHTWLRRILSILLATGMLIACNVTEKISDTQSEPDNQLSGTIVFWQSYPSNLQDTLVSQYKKSFDKYIKKFTKLYPQVKIIVELTEGQQQLVEELKSQVEMGLGPDLIYIQSVYTVPLIEADVLRSLDQDSVDWWQFRPDAIIQVLYKGKLYGLPLNLSTQALCYNKDKVNQIPETLSELIVQARQGYSVGMLSRFDDAFWGTQIFGGELLDDQGRMILAQGNGWARWMKWLKNAKNEPNFILNEDAFILQQAFVEAKLAYYVCWSYEIPFLRESLGSDKFGVALLPGGENELAAPALFANGLFFSSASSQAQAQIALRFAQFLTNKVVQTEMTTGFRAIIPANNNTIIDPRLFPIQGVLQKQSQAARAYSLDQTKKVDAIINYGRDYYTRVMAGEIAPEQAAKEFSQIINSQF